MRGEERVALALALAGFGVMATGVGPTALMLILLLVVLVVRPLATAWLDEWTRTRLTFLTFLGGAVFVTVVVRRVASVLA